MKTPAVSVLVPVYNVGAYIEKCARALMEQTMNDLEIIFINDASTDNSMAILAEVISQYPSRSGQINIIEMPKNSGSAAVRKVGLQAAHGDYIIYCDSDDWVNKDLYQQMYDLAEREDADVVVCDIIWEYKDQSILVRSTPIDDGKKLMQYWYRNNNGLHFLNKLIRRRIFIENDIYPHEGWNMWEDNHNISRLLYHCKKIAYLDSASAYHYNKMNGTSLTAAPNANSINQMIAIASDIEKFYASKPDSHLFQKSVDAFKYLAKLNLITCSFKDYGRFKILFPESNYIASELSLNAFSARGKLRFLMVRLHMAPLFILAFKLKNLLFK